MKILTYIFNESTSYAVNLPSYTDSGNRKNPVILPRTGYLYAGTWEPVDSGHIFIKQVEGLDSVTYNNPYGLIVIKVYSVTDKVYNETMRLLNTSYTRSIIYETPIKEEYIETQITGIIIPDAIMGSIQGTLNTTAALGGFIPGEVITIGGELTYGPPEDTSAPLGGTIANPGTSTATLGGVIPETHNDTCSLGGLVIDTKVDTHFLGGAKALVIGGESGFCFSPWTPYVRSVGGYISNTDYLRMHTVSFLSARIGDPLYEESREDRWTGVAKQIAFLGGAVEKGSPNTLRGWIVNA